MSSTENGTEVSSAGLAYLGDCVYELHVRQMLVEKNTQKPSVEALKYVTANAQSEALEKLLPVLTEEESMAYHRGRNCVHGNAPKSTSTGQYRRATGFEAIFGYAHLYETPEREKELFNIAMTAFESRTE